MNGPNVSGSVFGTRQGSVPVRHSYRVRGVTSTTATAIPGFYLKASSDRPLSVEVQVYVETADTGTSPTMSVGVTGSGYTDFISGASTAAVAFLPAANAVTRSGVTSNFQVYYKQGGTPNGVGSTWIIIDVYELNPAL